jgi:hypothetical protein
MHPACFRIALLCGALAAFSAAPFLAAASNAPAPAADDDNEPFVLPDYAVEAQRELPRPESWRYAAIPGFEILSSASDRTTQSLVRDLQEFAQVMSVVWPVRNESALPASLILCGRGGAFDTFRSDNDGATRERVGMASLHLRDVEQASIVLDVESASILLNTLDATTAGAAAATALATTETTATSTGGLPEWEVDHFRQLRREYVRFLLAQIEPRPPAWFEEGLAQIFTGMKWDRRRIIFAQVEDPTLVTPEEEALAMANAGMPSEVPAVTGKPAEQDRDFNKALDRRGLIPFEKFFAVPHDSPIARNPIGNRWAKQAQAFVHLCLYGRGKRYQKPFLELVARAGRGPITEEVFRECFGMSYRQMLTELRQYIEFTDYAYEEFRGKNGSELPEPAPVELREATEAEIGRIKGDALRLSGHNDAALQALVVPYLRGERDPRLLAALGLAENELGHTDRARKFLEAAARDKVPRARAHLVLAQLRLAEARAKPGAADGKLSAGQAVGVLRELFAARGQLPPLPEVYEAVAEVWSLSAVAPSRENLAVLKEGARLFPRRGPLLLKAAELHAQYGFREEAAALCALGLKASASDPALRARFERLLAVVQATPPPAAPAAPSAAPSP